MPAGGRSEALRRPAAAAAGDARRPWRRLGTQRLTAGLLLLPAAIVVLAVYIGCTLWTVRISFTASRNLPSSTFVGLLQYARLLGNERWQLSVEHLVIFGTGFVAAAMALGGLMAVLIDQRVRGETLFRSVYLYPYSMSFVVTGLIWQWMLNPGLGVQKLVRDLGWTGFTFDWLVDQDMVVYTLVIAAVWHGSGLVMAITLAGLRGIDEELWKAGRVEGIPRWRFYLSVVLPMLGPTFATTGVLLAISVVRLYDLVVALTDGGPGLASEVPAKFVMDSLFNRANLGLATAASTSMLVTVLAIVAPYLYLRQWRRRIRRPA